MAIPKKPASKKPIPIQVTPMPIPATRRMDEAGIKTLQAIIDDRPVEMLSGPDNTYVPVTYGKALAALSDWQDGLVENHGTRPHVRRIKIGDRWVPAPETQRPKDGTDYFVPDITGGVADVHTYMWTDDGVDETNLRAGHVHRDHKHAKEHAKALIALTALPDGPVSDPI